ncbi:cyclophilin-like fold protein [Burkholderia anthina]|uniref:cyclophilin-like fold protein n=1 Tax=Burkholderia anthina TaxID=179879 RepID=UPI00158AE08F|nr:cyclophilin-like fold protein [Burkholderia anthina]
MQIRINLEGGAAITVTLDDGAASRDFASLLPLKVELDDYASTEKIGDLPKRLSTQGAPAGFKPSAGDVAYYSPWGNLAIFYRDYSYAAGLVRLGKIDSGVEVLKAPGTLTATFEKVTG